MIRNPGEALVRAPARLRRIGPDVLDAELRQGAPHLGRLLAVDRPGLGRADSDEAARLKRDDCAQGFLDDAAPL